MHEYFININAESEGYQEVHRRGCRFLKIPVSKDYVSIGLFTSYYQALKEAFKKYPEVKECHSCQDFQKRQNIGK
jgi:hypothetical protein